MGRAGPTPRPVEVKLREGNPGHERLADVVTVGGRPVPAELAEPPDTVPADGKVWWAKHVPLLVESGVLDRVDVSLVELAAVMWARIQQSRRVLAADGHFTTGSVGQLRAHPSLAIERESVKEYKRLAVELGIGPLARTNLGLATLSGAAKMAELDRTLSGADDDWIEGTAASMDGAAVGLPGV